MGLFSEISKGWLSIDMVMDTPQGIGSLGAVAVGAVSGICFGFGLAKSRCVEPNALRGQMLMRNFLMMKLFMGCCIASILVVNLFRFLYPGAELPIEPFHPLADFIGGGTLGFGIAMSGGCPGTSPSATGLGLWRSNLGTTVGSFFGVWLWAVTPKSLLSGLYRSSTHSLTMPQMFGYDHLQFSLAMAAGMFLFVLVLDYFFPPHTELHAGPSAYLGWNPLRLRPWQTAWHPFFGGLLLGSMVFLGLVFFRTAMGSSSGFMALMGFALRPLSAARSFVDPYGKLAPYYNGSARVAVMGAYQAALLLAIVAGSALSSLADGSNGRSTVRDYYRPSSTHAGAVDADKHCTTGAHFLRAFIGATVFTYGTRLVNGCTSGHGVSGFGMMSPASLMYIVGIFAVGMATAYGEKIFASSSSGKSKRK